MVVTMPHDRAPQNAWRLLSNDGRVFACQQAYGLRYHTQRVGRRERAQRQIGKICQRLGGAYAVMASALPPKPTWMPWARTGGWRLTLRRRMLLCQMRCCSGWCGLRNGWVAGRGGAADPFVAKLGSGQGAETQLDLGRDGDHHAQTARGCLA